MRCPHCQDDYEPHVRHCADCGVELVPEATVVAAPPDARLGRFHPAVAELLLVLLERRGVAHETVTRDEAVEIVVDRELRDDLRAELTLGWAELLGGLGEDRAAEVRRLGGQQPGWLDPPRGGWVDRQGRMVVDVAEDDAEADRNRVVGPTLLVAGGVLVLLSWYADLGAGLVLVGVGAALLGLLLPR